MAGIGSSISEADIPAHWKSTSDEEWALLLLKTRWNDIDFAYLEQEAAKPEQGVADLLAALKGRAEQL